MTASWQEQSLEYWASMKDGPLHPDLEPWVETGGPFGSMLRHPLVYDLSVGHTPGLANRAYESKRKRLAEAEAARDWHTIVFLHERPYRLKALIDYCTGRDLDGFIVPLILVPEHWDLATDVWVDSENIGQNQTEWRALMRNGHGLWLGTDEDRAAFDAMPDPIRAWRGGSVGDWSWTTSRATAEFFARRNDLTPRQCDIPKADVFGYITGRGESELLVRLTDERREKVYPNG